MYHILLLHSVLYFKIYFRLQVIISRGRDHLFIQNFQFVWVWVKLNSLFSCHYSSHDYSVVTATICMLYLFFGVFCTFFGYRCFKATMFLMGFVFGSLVVYLICMEEEVLPPWANTSIAVSAGVLFGLITLLVQYVGLFMLGFHGGLILGIIILCSFEIFGHSLSSPDSGDPWISVGILLLCGLVMSLCNLYFQVRIWKKVYKFASCQTGTSLVNCIILAFLCSFMFRLWHSVKTLRVSSNHKSRDQWRFIPLLIFHFCSNLEKKKKNKAENYIMTMKRKWNSQCFENGQKCLIFISDSKSSKITFLKCEF